jgi:hypothetical protein
MERKTRIRASDIAEDIRKGVSDPKLMEKYGLSAKGLSSAFQKLVDAGIMDEGEFDNRTAIYKDTVDIDEARYLDRCYALYEVSVCEANNPKNAGYVVDINEQGMQATGIEAELNEKKQFLIIVDQFPGVTRISFEAECRWSKTEPGDGERVSGFQITKIEPDGMEQLRKLISAVTMWD